MVPVKECCELIVDCINKTAPSVPYRTPYKMIRTTNVRNGLVDLSECKYVTYETYKKWTRRATVQEGDVILTREAPIGQVGLIRGDDTVFLGQRLVQYRADRSVLDPHFLLYAFMSPALQSQFRAHEGSGSVVSHIRVGDCFKFQIPLPPLSEQKRIATLLAALDNRWLLLKKQNLVLESIAQAVFKSWFIDFDPVRAKAEGREPEGMDAETAALFPGEFRESSQGPIPEGWEIRPLGEVFRVTMGQSPPGDTYNQDGHGLPFYQGRADFGFRFPGKRVYCTAPTRRAAGGDTLLSVRAPVGDINIALQDCAIGRGVAAIRHDYAPSFAYYTMWSLSKELKLFEGEGTVFGSVTQKQLAELLVLCPPKPVLEAFQSVVGVLDSRILTNEMQCRSLMALRDTLLPRLISGRLRIPEAEEALKEAL